MKRTFHYVSFLLCLMAYCIFLAPDAVSINKEPFIFAGRDNFAPYSYISEGVPSGYAVDLMKILSAAINRKISIKLLSSEDCLTELKNGTIDGLIGMPVTDEYKNFADYSLSSAKLEFVIFAETSNQTVTSIKSLEGTVVALHKECSILNYVKKNERVKIIEADSIEDAFLKLKNREITAVIAEKAYALWYIRQTKIPGLKIAGPAINFSPEYALAVAKKHPDILKEINRALNILDQNGTLGKLKQKWFGLNFVEPFPWKMVSLVIGVISGIMILLLGGLWTVSLNAALKIKTRQIQIISKQMVEKDKLAVLGKLAGHIAHELRTPLSIIAGAVYLLHKEGFDDKELCEKHLNLVEEKIKHTSNILESILSYSRIKAEIASTVSAKDCLYKVLKEMEIPHGIKQQIFVEKEQFLLVFIDFHQLYSVFRNLVLNAVQAMEQNGVLTIEMFPSDDNLTVNARISDTGGGIPEEAQDKIFHPFYTSKVTGTGLGLAISKSIIEANKGRLYLEKTTKQGSSFMLQLPSSRMLIRNS